MLSQSALEMLCLLVDGKTGTETTVGRSSHHFIGGNPVRSADFTLFLFLGCIDKAGGRQYDRVPEQDFVVNGRGRSMLYQVLMLHRVLMSRDINREQILIGDDERQRWSRA